MLRKYFPPYFFVTLAAVTLAASLVWLDTFRSYEAEAVALVVERSNFGGKSAATLVGLSRTLPFYDRVLSSNELLEDTAAGMTPERRKASWLERVRVITKDEGGVLTIQAWGENQEEARLLARATIETLFETASLYYNIKTDLDVRLIENAVIRPVVRSYPRLVLWSLVSGIIITSLFFAILSALDRLFSHQRSTPFFSHVPSEQHISPDTFKPVPPAYFPVQEERTEYIAPEAGEDDLHVTFETAETAHQPSAKAAAPPNLPILEEGELSPLLGAQARLIKQDIDATVARQSEETEVVHVPRTEEPSNEEYRRRLNDLLSGK